MKGFKHIIYFLIFLTFSSLTVFPNPTNHIIRLYQSYKTGDMREWVIVINELNQIYSKNQSIELLFEITQAQYGYIGYLIGVKETDEARKYLKKAESNIDKILSIRPQNHDALAIKGSLFAYHISLSPYKAPFLGPKSMSTIDQAYTINSNSPQVLIEKGNSRHYAPSMFGGDPKLATSYYKRAAEIMEAQNGGSPPQLWLYLNTLAQLALAYEKVELYKDAGETYKKILRVAPDFKWVKEELYPKFVKKNKS